MIVLFFYFGKGFRVLCKRLPIMASIICIVDVEIPITPILLCARNPEGLFRDARFIPKVKHKRLIWETIHLCCFPFVLPLSLLRSFNFTLLWEYEILLVLFIKKRF